MSIKDQVIREANDQADRPGYTFMYHRNPRGFAYSVSDGFYESPLVYVNEFSTAMLAAVMPMLVDGLNQARNDRQACRQTANATPFADVSVNGAQLYLVKRVNCACCVATDADVAATPQA